MKMKVTVGFIFLFAGCLVAWFVFQVIDAATTTEEETRPVVEAFIASCKERDELRVGNFVTSALSSQPEFSQCFEDLSNSSCRVESVRLIHVDNPGARYGIKTSSEFSYEVMVSWAGKGEYRIKLIWPVKN